MEKGKAEEGLVFDNADEENDGRKSTEINIDMLADRRDSFEVARISSPEVRSFSIPKVRSWAPDKQFLEGVKAQPKPLINHHLYPH